MGQKKAESKVEEDAVDILIEILDKYGAFRKETDDDDSWDLLSSSLERLGNVLSKRDRLKEDVDALDTQILEIEDVAQEVRLRGTILSNETKEIPHELLLFCQELESTYPKLRLMARSLKGAICQQRLLVNDMLLSVHHSLSSLYGDADDQVKAIANFKHTSTWIKRRCIRSNSSPWKDALLMVKEVSKQVGSEKSISPTLVHQENTKDAAIINPSKEFNKPTRIDMVMLNHSLMDAVKAFFSNQSSFTKKNFFSMLVAGAEGTGKTYCCNEIERIVGEKVEVIRPSLPFDIMGQTVGATEDLMISIFSAASRTSKPSILILDDIETICGDDFESSSKNTSESSDGGGRNGREPHVIARVRTLFLSLLDRFRMDGDLDSRTLLVCTSKINFGKSIDRFDTVYTLSNPNESERRVILSHHIKTLETGSDAHASVQNMLSNLVECTAGSTYAELAQHCRQALLFNHEQARNSKHTDEESNLGFLTALKEQLQLSTPESLRSGVNPDFIDMKVLSARDLQEMSKISEGSSLSLPLFGQSAATAWQELLRMIVMPICQTEALENLLHLNGTGSGKVFAGGVVLTGDPGVGKSALAYHAATVASIMNPSLKLVDVSCTSLISKEVGSSERSIHHLFEAARAAAPCIMLMDGIENIAAVRGNDNTTEGTMDRVLSTLLTELDGVDSDTFSLENPSCLSIIGITHNHHWIDPALRRPGRLGCVIKMDRPEHEARKAIVMKEVASSSYVHDDSIISNDYSGLDSLAEHVAAETRGFTAAGVIAVCNEAKLLSSKAWCEDQEVALHSSHVLQAIESQRAGGR